MQKLLANLKNFTYQPADHHSKWQSCVTATKKCKSWLQDLSASTELKNLSWQNSEILLRQPFINWSIFLLTCDSTDLSLEDQPSKSISWLLVPWVSATTTQILTSVNQILACQAQVLASALILKPLRPKGRMGRFPHCNREFFFSGGREDAVKGTQSFRKRRL